MSENSEKVDQVMKATNDSGSNSLPNNTKKPKNKNRKNKKSKELANKSEGAGGGPTPCCGPDSPCGQSGNHLSETDGAVGPATDGDPNEMNAWTYNKLQDIKKAVEMLNLYQGSTAAKTPEDALKKRYEFWDTQPVPKLDEVPEVNQEIEANKSSEQIKPDSLNLPQDIKTLGFRKMQSKDVKKVQTLLASYLNRFDLSPVFDFEEMVHWFTPKEDVVDSYVVERPGKEGKKGATEIIGFASFYTLPSSVMHHPTYKSIKAAYAFYTVASGDVSLHDLMQDVLTVAKNAGYDVFNALDLMDNKEFLEKLKFGIGDGNLQYYLFNWKCPPLSSEKIALVLQ
ncbi:unnamed protein product [Medioppia subpectinata]|uniref:Glycylpeptide N-tetradecanoyltransferase n=1 Tax=Medioppia subpectinata TaxID=1979941 RepID=A0A7R9KUS4_9ACAR|nr:unnamed protein product [Medioppia subpectinata]CAG2109844.1 unnamed protein product [Medioppia subpectinata]